MTKATNDEVYGCSFGLNRKRYFWLYPDLCSPLRHLFVMTQHLPNEFWYFDRIKEYDDIKTHILTHTHVLTF